MATTSMKIMYVATSTRPGTKAPMNMSPALVETASKPEGMENSPVSSL